MITRIAGTLESIDEGRATLACPPLWYDIFVPGADQQRLASRLGEQIIFHTLHSLESQQQGNAFVPRLIGFQSPKDRAFFELFTTVKGIGARKALRSLQLPFGSVAAAIAGRDVKLLQSLPEIGRRLAETIVAELSGKVDRFVDLGSDSPSADGTAEQMMTGRQSVAQEALAVLVSLGEPRVPALQLIDRALRTDPELTSSDQLVAAVYRLKDLPV